MTTLRLDAHQHFWDPAAAHYPWLRDGFAPIARPFAPADLAPEIARAAIDGTILVQTRNDLAETHAFLALASATPWIAGVVGWADLTDPELATTLADLKASAHGGRLVGLRHLVQDEADPDWLLRPDVRRGLALLPQHGLAFDLLVKSAQLPAALRTVADFPDLRFILDHGAKPDIAGNAFASWSAAMRPFAAHRGHVWCKLSGFITEADWATWTPDHLKPYVVHLLDIFGPARCMFGSDWPVCLVAGSYAQVVDALQGCVSHLSDDDRAWIFERAAAEAYRLPCA